MPSRSGRARGGMGWGYYGGGMPPPMGGPMPQPWFSPPMYGPPMMGPMPYGPYGGPTLEQQLEMLQWQAEYFEDILEGIKQQIEEVEKAIKERN